MRGARRVAFPLGTGLVGAGVLVALLLIARLLWPPHLLAKDQAEPSYECESEPIGGYQACVFTDANGQTMNFLLNVPAGYDSHKKYPLVLLLHGGGERGHREFSVGSNLAVLTRLNYVSVWAPHKEHASVQSRWPSFVVVPQLMGRERWVDISPRHGSYRLSPEPTLELKTARDIVDYLRREYPGIDGRRVYLTGISLGGYGSWDALERWPKYFTAALIASGAGDPSNAAVLKDIPIWVLHGADDPIVPVSGSVDMFHAIKALGGSKVQFTEVPYAGHDIWGIVYNITSPTHNHVKWLFSQRKGGP